MYTPALDFVLLIPCYNNRSGLITSLKSVQYPKEKCQVLIVDDGSTPPLSLEELQQEISTLTIRVLRIDTNKGIANALNAGLSTIQTSGSTKYIARLDAGDTCLPERFHKQVTFLETHPEIVLLGSWARFQTEAKDGYDYITKTNHEDILKEMHYKCSFIHPSVMFKQDVLKTVGFYPTNYPHAEDYAFFWKIIKMYKGAVLPEKLVTISYSKKNISSKNYTKQLQSRKMIVRKFGDRPLHKWIGIGLLNLKGIVPKTILHFIKSLRNPRG